MSNDELRDDEPMDLVELLTEMVMALVDHPGDVHVEERVEGATLAYAVHCAPQDRGIVIGKGGDAIQALRTLLGRVAARQKRRVTIEVANSRFDRNASPPRELRRVAS